MTHSYLEGLILDVEDGERGRVTLTQDGRQVDEAKITLSEEGIEKLKQGYLCGRCLEDLTPLGAFPEQCPTCGFHVKTLQAEQLQRDYVGQEVLGPGVSLSDELARMGEIWIPKETP
jgi:hypothetical protein